MCVFRWCCLQKLSKCPHWFSSYLRATVRTSPSNRQHHALSALPHHTHTTALCPYIIGRSITPTLQVTTVTKWWTAKTDERCFYVPLHRLKRLVFLRKQCHILPCQLFNQTMFDQHDQCHTKKKRINICHTYKPHWSAGQWQSHTFIHSFICQKTGAEHSRRSFKVQNQINAFCCVSAAVRVLLRQHVDSAVQLPLTGITNTNAATHLYLKRLCCTHSSFRAQNSTGYSLPNTYNKLRIFTNI